MKGPSPSAPSPGHQGENWFGWKTAQVQRRERVGGHGAQKQSNLKSRRVSQGVHDVHGDDHLSLSKESQLGRGFRPPVSSTSPVPTTNHPTEAEAWNSVSKPLKETKRTNSLKSLS